MDEQQKLQNYIDWIERLNGGAIHRLKPEDIYKVVDFLIGGTPQVWEDVKTTSKVVRARKLKTADKFDSIEKLGPPSKEDCKHFGRCNMPGHPVLYAGVGHELVFSEIGAKQGDIVGLLHMNPVKDLRVIQLGALDQWRRTSGRCLLSENTKELIAEAHRDPKNITAFLLDAFVRDYFSRPGCDSVYALTSAYTTAVMSEHREMAGLMYDSVDHTAGTCLALTIETFKSLLRPTNVQIVRVTNYLGYGIFDFEEICRTDKFDGNTIIW